MRAWISPLENFSYSFNCEHARRGFVFVYSIEVDGYSIANSSLSVWVHAFVVFILDKSLAARFLQSSLLIEQHRLLDHSFIQSPLQRHTLLLVCRSSHPFVISNYGYVSLTSPFLRLCQTSLSFAELLLQQSRVRRYQSWHMYGDFMIE